MVGVGEVGTHRDSTGCRVDDTAHGSHLARMLVDRAVGELQLHSRIALYSSVYATPCLAHLQKVFLCHREVNLHCRVVRHGCEGLLRRSAHESTYAVRQVAYNTVSRRSNEAEVEVLLSRYVCCPCLSELGGSALHCVLCRLQLVRTDYVVLEEFLRVVVCKSCSVELCLCSVHRCLCLTNGSGVCNVVDDKQQLTCLNRLTFLHAKLCDEARHFRANLHVLNTLDRCRIGGLQVCVLTLNCAYSVFVVAEVRLSATLSAAT